MIFSCEEEFGTVRTPLFASFGVEMMRIFTKNALFGKNNYRKYCR